MQMSIRRNPHRTRYITWLDIGHFRSITTSATDPNIAEAPPGQCHFRLGLPPDFKNETSVAFNEVYARDKALTPKAVIYGTKVWLGGAYFIGRVDQMYQWTVDYLEAYEWLIRNNLTSADEQVTLHYDNTE